MNSTIWRLIRNVGITSTLKNYVTISSERSVSARNAAGIHRILQMDTLIFAFHSTCYWEDYRRVVINTCHELTLIRSRNDNNCLIGDSTRDPEITLFKVQWRMPHMLLNEINKLSSCMLWKAGDTSAWLFAHGICTSFRYCIARPNVRGPSKPLLSWRNRDM